MNAFQDLESWYVASKRIVCISTYTSDFRPFYKIVYFEFLTFQVC